jgi:hypothetical protein
VKYNELIQLYFDRSNALQAYWTLYVMVLGGLLAVSSLNKQPSILTTLIVTILFSLFAYKNLDAIHDTALNRFAALDVIKQHTASEGEDPAALKQLRDVLEPTLLPASFSSSRATHVVSDALTIAALWALEWRRRNHAAKDGMQRVT